MPNQYTGPVSTVDRFWSKVVKEMHERVAGLGPCWPSSAAPMPQGYGRIRLARHGRIVSTHRYSWEIHYGSIPEGMWVLHKCDNPPCIRPDHLFLGSVTDNNRDMASKKRLSMAGIEAARVALQRKPSLRARGAKNGMATLTDAHVHEIRRRHEQDEAQRAQLAQEFGVSTSTIAGVLRRKTWRHVE